MPMLQITVYLYIVFRLLTLGSFWQRLHGERYLQQKMAFLNPSSMHTKASICYDDTNEHTSRRNNSGTHSPFKRNGFFHAGYFREPLHHFAGGMVAICPCCRAIHMWPLQKGEY